MGWLQREIGQYGAALENFRKAYPIGIRLNGDAAEIDADLGDVYLFSGDSQRANGHYQKTLFTLKDFVFQTSYRGPPSKQEITACCSQIVMSSSQAQSPEPILMATSGRISPHPTRISSSILYSMRQSWGIKCFSDARLTHILAAFF